MGALKKSYHVNPLTSLAGGEHSTAVATFFWPKNSVLLCLDLCNVPRYCLSLFQRWKNSTALDLSTRGQSDRSGGSRRSGHTILGWWGMGRKGVGEEEEPITED